MPPPTQIVFCSAHRWKTFAIFNANAFPDATKTIVEACGSRLALVFHHTTSLATAIERDRTEFIGALERQRHDMEKALSSRPDLSCVARYDGLAYIAEMHSCFYALKSFLDLYAKLIGKLIHPNNEWAFNKANIDGTKVAGGRFVKGLQSCSREAFANKIATLTLEQSRAWITTAVAYRDQLSHRSDLDQMTHMQLPLSHEPPHFRLEEIIEPRMPNGQPAQQYFEALLELLSEYIRRSIVLVPNVDLNRIYPDRFGE